MSGKDTTEIIVLLTGDGSPRTNRHKMTHRSGTKKKTTNIVDRLFPVYKPDRNDTASAAPS
ncbi:MAG: hypothetical protein QF692_00320 [Alphaproteobacteria bacterium]|jgi:hypothetical protein|nr:hypothetical protein [Alphaproteobacteria bacterium]MDP7221691.1 hypothetical protein [Alphaproteobacteria bacterium]